MPDGFSSIWHPPPRVRLAHLAARPARPPGNATPVTDVYIFSCLLQWSPGGLPRQVGQVTAFARRARRIHFPGVPGRQVGPMANEFPDGPGRQVGPMDFIARWARWITFPDQVRQMGPKATSSRQRPCGNVLEATPSRQCPRGNVLQASPRGNVFKATSSRQLPRGSVLKAAPRGNACLIKKKS